MDRWKLIKSGRGGRWELYDLVADGTEVTDVAEKYPELVEEMARRFEQWRMSLPDPSIVK